jgi:hypothetical protein
VADDRITEEAVRRLRDGIELSTKWREELVQVIEAKDAEIARLRELAEVKYELLRAEKGYDVLAELAPRIDKLYMALNAEARGDAADFDGEPLEDGKAKWNRLVGLAATTLTRWVAAERWAALEHRAAEDLRASLAMVNEGTP